MSNQANRVRTARQALANAEAATGVQRGERSEGTWHEPTERERQLRLFYQLARRTPLGRHFSDAVDLGIWAISEWRWISPRPIAEEDRERVAIVVSDMWSVLEQFEETGEPSPTGHGPILLGAWFRAWRTFKRGA